MHRNGLRRLALFPMISLLPLALVAGALAIALEALLRVRRLERRVARAPAA